MVSCSSWPASNYVTIFNSTDTPARTDLTDYSRLVLGLRFTTPVAGNVTAVRFFKARSEGGTDHTANIYEWSSGKLLATSDYVNDAACTGGQWVSIPLSPPLATSVGTEYVVALDSLLYYAKSDVFDMSGKAGRPVVPTVGGAVYSFRSGHMPKDAASYTANYWIDGEHHRDKGTAGITQRTPCS